TVAAARAIRARRRREMKKLSSVLHLGLMSRTYRGVEPTEPEHVSGPRRAERKGSFPCPSTPPPPPHDVGPHSPSRWPSCSSPPGAPPDPVTNRPRQTRPSRRP